MIRPRSWRRTLAGLPPLLLIGLIPPAHAGEESSLPKAVSISQLLAIVKDRSPRYAALKQQIEISQAEVVAAGVMPNPRVNFGNFTLMSQNNTMYSGKNQYEVILEIPVLASGQRGARIEAAEKQVAVTEAGVDAEFSTLAYDIWRLFVKLLALKERVAILDETYRDMQHLSALVTGREEAGSASRFDVLRISLETHDLVARLENTRNDLLGTSGELGVALGLPNWNPEALGTLKPLGIPADANRLWAEAERSNPEIEMTRRGEHAADAGLERARSERWPVPSFLIGSAFTDNPWGHAIFGGVSVELPVFDYGQGGMARAATEKQKATLARAVATSQTRVAIDRAAALLARRQDTRSNFERDVLAKLPDLKAMGEAAYRFGKGSLLELLDATRSRTEVRLTYVELSQAETEAELDALRASGLLIKTLETPAPVATNLTEEQPAAPLQHRREPGASRLPVTAALPSPPK